MWGSVLALALVTALNPARLAVTLLVISRPRPVQNLLVYGLGCLLGCVPAVVIPLTLLHITPTFKSFADGLAASGTVRHLRIGMGVLALLVAVALTVRALTHRRQRAQLSARDTSTLVLDSRTPPVIARVVERARRAAAEGGTGFRRLLGHVHDAWENGSVWLAFVIGLALGGVEPDVGLLLLSIIVASGAPIGAQVAAAIAFVVGVLAIAEITLIGYLAMPADTEKVLQRLHDWALTHRRRILVAMLALGGISLVASGIGVV
ncbi:GAP family protein [Mycobacterium sp. 94-17]|uniref:GAP family protein n=1 Tax=Mycobacterium sp. 94-17 TaxID=2986147 RepID=UPI002D1E9528|nr:GAP family protein [Mycobacterium sp. 94-17]MEB4211821.1 GAP family protein [Mycobacterium sp. 94-17]